MPLIILCERTGAWAAAIGRHLPDGVRLRQVRSLSECAAELCQAPGSLLALELASHNIEASLDLLGGLGRKFPRARAMVFADRRLAGYRALVTEAGAIYFACSPRELEGLKVTIRNFLSRLPEASASFAEQVWDELPWDENAVA